MSFVSFQLLLKGSDNSLKKVCIGSRVVAISEDGLEVHIKKGLVTGKSERNLSFRFL